MHFNQTIGTFTKSIHAIRPDQQVFHKKQGFSKREWVITVLTVLTVTVLSYSGILCDSLGNSAPLFLTLPIAIPFFILFSSLSSWKQLFQVYQFHKKHQICIQYNENQERAWHFRKPILY
ncbi:hypothetical protein BC941DRAFT_440755 [Chlamydoabsidia padenii]|nr:hypothetical protein BC941DRAFT_440755 [Chlamydoabsidia padenii]